MNAIVAAALGFCFAGAAAAQPIERPQVKVGDRWTYQRMNYDSGKAGGRYEMAVVFAERGVIQLVSTYKYKDDEVDTTFTADWNAVSTASRVFNPHTGWFKFPLQVGDSHKAAYDSAIPKKKWSARNERQVTVVGWEEVAVPAGRFRALKIVSEGRYQRLDDPLLSGSSRNVIWYVPSIKRWAKITLENRPATGKGRGEHSGEELVDYKIQ